jgi:hypothetical protein
VLLEPASALLRDDQPAIGCVRVGPDSGAIEPSLALPLIRLTAARYARH